MSLRSHALSPRAEPILVIAPHQDDCTLGCGGFIFQQRLAGATVHVVYLTDGSASHPMHPAISPADLAAMRQREAYLAKSRLYVDSANLHFLNLPDGQLPHLKEAERDTAIIRLSTLLTELQPALVILPCRHDGSTEHEAGFHLVQRALATVRPLPRLLEYPIWANFRPSGLLRPALTADQIHHFDFRGYGILKRHALSAYVSQFKPLAPWTQPVLSAEFAAGFDNEREYFFEFKR